MNKQINEIDSRIATLKRILATNKYADKKGFSLLIADLEKQKQQVK